MMEYRDVINLLSGLLLTWIFCGSGCTPRCDGPVDTSSVDSIVIVLGNEPLDEATPTVEMLARVKKAVEFQRRQSKTFVLFTGGRTAGPRSEARMMADIAIDMGASVNSMGLEEDSRTTKENAQFAARLLRDAKCRRIYLVSSPSHLEWALSVFRSHDVFANVMALPTKGNRQESISQMEEYLKKNDSRRVRERLQWLREGVRGPD